MITLFSKRALCILSLFFYSVGIYAIEVATHIPKQVKNVLNNVNETEIKDFLNNTRRIVVGTEAKETRPYMVYLKLPANNPKYKDYRRWLCGGVIIHEEYILTSAACIEDARHFYIVSGTFVYDENDDRYNNPCIKNGAKKAIWKCVPRNYMFDGHENDNIRWMNNDIAIIKSEDEFDFTRRIRGCDFIPRPICYNNQTQKLEEAENSGFIAGWGSHKVYNEPSSENSKRQLLETEVRIISKTSCKKRWGKRYHNIIDNYMICTKDIIPDLSEICSEKYVDCTDISYESEEDARRVYDPEKLVLHSAYHNSSGFRKQGNLGSGGFCENDHGGPLIHGSGSDLVVIGIISACLVKEGSNRCYGPFLYTSVWRNRFLINCAIFKDHTGGCDKLFRAGGTHTEETMSWADHPDGPAKNELKAGAVPLQLTAENQNQVAVKTLSATLNQAEVDSLNDAAEQPLNKVVEQLNLAAAAAAPKQLNDKKVEPQITVAEEAAEEAAKLDEIQRRQLNKTIFSTTGPRPKLVSLAVLGTTKIPNRGATSISDKAIEHSGVVLRSVDENAPRAKATTKA